MRVVVPEEVVMQPRLPVAILVLQPERLVRIGNIGFLREFAPAAIVAEPQQPSLAVGHLPRQADLVAVEVVDLPSGFARFVLPFANLRQRFIRILVGIDVGIASVRVNFLQQAAAVPNEFDAAAGDGFQTAFPVGGGAVFFADFNLFFGNPAVERVVFVAPDFLAALPPDFGQHEAVFEVVAQGAAAAVGQAHEGEVAEGVVVVFGPVVGFDAVVSDGGGMCFVRRCRNSFGNVFRRHCGYVDDVVRRIEGE